MREGKLFRSRGAPKFVLDGLTSSNSFMTVAAVLSSANVVLMLLLRAKRNNLLPGILLIVTIYQMPGVSCVVEMGSGSIPTNQTMVTLDLTKTANILWQMTYEHVIGDGLHALTIFTVKVAIIAILAASAWKLLSFLICRKRVELAFFAGTEMSPTFKGESPHYLKFTFLWNKQGYTADYCYTIEICRPIMTGERVTRVESSCSAATATLESDKIVIHAPLPVQGWDVNNQHIYQRLQPKTISLKSVAWSQIGEPHAWLDNEGVVFASIQTITTCRLHQAIAREHLTQDE